MVDIRPLRSHYWLSSVAAEYTLHRNSNAEFDNLIPPLDFHIDGFNRRAFSSLTLCCLSLTYSWHSIRKLFTYIFLPATTYIWHEMIVWAWSRFGGVIMLRFSIVSRRPQIRVSAGTCGILSLLVEFSLPVFKYCCIAWN